MFLENARKGNNAGWIYFLTIMLCFLAATLSAFLIAEYTYIDPLEKNKTLASLLLPFCFILAELLFCVTYLHRRPPLSLFTSFQKIRFYRILFGFFVWLGLLVAVELASAQILKVEYQFNFSISAFLILFGISFSLLLVQSLTEELFFRGYLMQGFANLAKNKWFPLVMTSVIFGTMHIANPEVQKLGYIIMIYYIGTGLFLGILTLMDEGMELALGFHAANNLIAALLITSDWSAFQTESILKDNSEPSAGFEILVPVFIIFPILLFIFSKKYGWTNWKERLTGKIEEKNVEPF